MRIVFLFIFAFNLSSSQINSNLIELIEMRRDFTLNSIKLSNIEQYGHEVINNEISFLKTGLKYQNNTKLYPINKVDSIFHYLNLGNNSFYNNLNDSGQGAEYYIKAIEIARDVGNKPIICHTIRAKLWYQIWFSYGNLLENDEFLDLYKSNLYSEREKDIYSFFEALISLRKEKHESEDLKTISLTELPDYYKSWWFNDVAVFYHKKNKFKLSVDTFLKSIQIIDSNNSFIYKLKKAAIYENLVKASIRTNKLKDAKKYLKKALLDDYDNKLFLQNKTYYIYHKAEYFKNVKKWDSAYLYMVEFNSLISDLNQRKTLFQVQDLNKKYQTAEKEKQILLEQEQKKRFRNGVITLGSLLLLGSVIFFLIQKNTKRKQLLAIQEKEIESQKVTTLLKEQELTAIDAMIEGQEKERQRIANDLHDDLGGLMATVKLHFNALKGKQSPELYKKTNELLDEAYNKVRSVAHAKNSGVMAKKGLLKALNDMAKTVSASNQLQVDIVDHGLDERLENSLELTIFRIIQELITNIIKHAEATEASIHITKHEDSLNIMVEDNGKGFNTKNIAKKSGMGIHSIDKRIENLRGSVTIESEINKGTTIIIDIPS